MLVRGIAYTTSLQNIGPVSHLSYIAAIAPKFQSSANWQRATNAQQQRYTAREVWLDGKAKGRGQAETATDITSAALLFDVVFGLHTPSPTPALTPSPTSDTIVVEDGFLQWRYGMQNLNIPLNFA